MAFWSRGFSQKAFHDKAYERSKLAKWDGRWHDLSVAARTAFVTKINFLRPSGSTRLSSGLAVSNFNPEVLRELTAAGFVETRAAQRKKDATEVILPAEVADFATRLRTIQRLHLLDPKSNTLNDYFEYAFFRGPATGHLFSVFQRAHIGAMIPEQDLKELYLTKRYWPLWVAKSLNDPLVPMVLDKIRAAGGRVILAALPAMLPKFDPKAIRGAVEQLVVNLALFEDLDPKSNDLAVGLLPSVYEDEIRAQQPRKRPSLEPNAHSAEVGPEGGVTVPDMRNILLELAASPARLRRQDGALFQKEVERFEPLLDPLPTVSTAFEPGTTMDSRLDNALHWALPLRFADRSFGDPPQLSLTKDGHGWLARSVERQYADVYTWLREPSGDESTYLYAPWGPSRFLGSHIQAIPGAKMDRSERYRPNPERNQPLFAALHRTFTELPLGAFVPLDTFLDRAAFGEHNPLLLGRGLSDVTILDRGRQVPAIEDQVEKVGKQLLREMLTVRLIPFGCVQLGWDDKRRFLIARRPRLDAFFGKAPPTDESPPDVEATRVVVQPDFSVMILGLNPTPAAELAPLCERVPGRSGYGSLTLRITRNSVIRAVSAGLSAVEIVARLQRHASTPVPKNVLTEVRDWAGWVREVTAGPMLVFRCPDVETTTRLQAALGRQAERLGETHLGLSESGISTALRQKLLSQGIIVTANKS